MNFKGKKFPSLGTKQQISKEYKETKTSIRKLAKKYNVSIDTVRTAIKLSDNLEIIELMLLFWKIIIFLEILVGSILKLIHI